MTRGQPRVATVWYGGDRAEYPSSHTQAHTPKLSHPSSYTQAHTPSLYTPKLTHASSHTQPNTPKLTLPSSTPKLISVLCRMKMLPVMISANYHSSARSAVSESPNSSARLVSQCPNSSARLVSQCPNSSSRLVFPMFQVELATCF